MDRINVCLKADAPVWVVFVVKNHSKTSQVNRHVATIARDQNYCLAYHVCELQFVEHIRISSVRSASAMLDLFRIRPYVSHDSRTEDTITPNGIEAGPPDCRNKYIAIVAIKLD